MDGAGAENNLPRADLFDALAMSDDGTAGFQAIKAKRSSLPLSHDAQVRPATDRLGEICPSAGGARRHVLAKRHREKAGLRPLIDVLYQGQTTRHGHALDGGYKS